MSDSSADSAYIAALWEHPTLCLAFFGIQFLSEEGQRLYDEAGINQEMFEALEKARSEGLLLNRPVMSPEGPVLMQYWRSYEALDRWARYDRERVEGHVPHPGCGTGVSRYGRPRSQASPGSGLGCTPRRPLVR